MIMTRIVSEKFHCGNCGAELSRSKTLSYFVRPGFPKPSEGLGQEYSMCPECGYIAHDLSEPTSPERKAILESQEYKDQIRFGRYFCVEFHSYLLGFVAMKEERYEEAMILYLKASQYNGYEFSNQMIQLVFDYLLERGVDGELAADLSLQGPAYAREKAIECSELAHYDVENGEFVHVYDLIDAQRKNGHFERAIQLAKQRLGKQGEEHLSPMLEKQIALSEARDAASEA